MDFNITEYQDHALKILKRDNILLPFLTFIDTTILENVYLKNNEYNDTTIFHINLASLHRTDDKVVKIEYCDSDSEFHR